LVWSSEDNERKGRHKTTLEVKTNSEEHSEERFTGMEDKGRMASKRGRNGRVWKTHHLAQREAGER